MSTKTASAASQSQNAGAGLHIPENFEAVLAAGIDKVFKRTFANPMESDKFYKEMSISTDHYTFQSHYGLSTIGMNRDAEELPYDEKGLGFSNTISTNVYRGAVAIEKTLKETDMYGVVRNQQQDLADATKRTIELVKADGVNRCLGTAPFLCEDGMYWIDDDRPSPKKGVPVWSNLETTGAISPDLLWTVQLNFAAHKDELGYPSPLKLGKVHIRPSDEKAIWEIVRSDLRPTDSMNARNFQFGRFEYSVYSYMTTAQILYEATEGENEIYFVWRVHPEFETWKDGSNPDITNQRVRCAFGLGAGAPHRWRGGALSS